MFAVSPLVERVGGVRGIGLVIRFAARSEGIDHEHGVVVPPSHVGEQVLAGPVIHRRLEQLLIGDVLDRFGHALVRLTHGADQVRLVHRASIGTKSRQTLPRSDEGKGMKSSAIPLQSALVMTVPLSEPLMQSSGRRDSDRIPRMTAITGHKELKALRVGDLPMDYHTLRGCREAESR
jgi:hypothetical protein